MTITPLPQPPGPDRPTTLEADTQAFLNALPGFVAEANGYGAELAGAATPGGLTIPYIFATSTAGDPTTGKIAVNTATQNLSGIVRASETDGAGTGVNGLLMSMALSTSAAKGYLRLTKVGDASKWLVWRVTAVTDQGAYEDVAVTIVASSSANPFAAGDAVVLTFTPAGDAGASSPWSPILTTANVTGQTQITFSSIPTTYGDLGFLFDVTLSTNENLRVAVSANNGVNWSSPVGLTQQLLTSYKGNIIFFDYRADFSTWHARFSSSFLSSPAVQDPNGGQGAGNVAATGGVNAVRFSLGSGSFESGTIKARAQ